MPRQLYLLLFLALLLTNCSTDAKLEIGNLDIIPIPVDLQMAEGYFNFSEKTKLSVLDEALLPSVAVWLKDLNTQAGWDLSIATKTEDSAILIEIDTELQNDAYSLTVSPQQIQIKAANPAASFYALQTLEQMLPLSYFAANAAGKAYQIPCVTIRDQPRFGWRGFMLDVSRHFFTVEQVKEVLDMMAELKLNRFHWHLTDDQGWRVEIKQYPKLTEVGAWRVDHTNYDETISDWWGRPVQQASQAATYGGFYTQAAIKEVVAYAKARHIEVIPEIDMPGHAQATIAAYPELGCVNAAPHVATGGVFKNNTYNPGKEATYVFVENMLNEIIDLFPYDYIHIGGDECNKSQWKIDPDAQRKMRDEGLETEEELQSYFIKRVEKIINARGRKMIGWDEILEGGLAPNAVVMSWRGEEGGIAAAKAGHEVIMTPNKYCYIDLKQGHDDLEPNLGYSQLLLSTAYNYEVSPETLSAEEQAYIKGIQANLWTESITDWGKLTYMTFPRVFAIAENAWSSAERKDWNGFSDRLRTKFAQLEAQNIRYANSAFSPWIRHQGVGEAIEYTLDTEVEGLDIYYTTDGTEPNLSSSKFTGPFQLETSATIKARAFHGDQALGRTTELAFPVHQARGAKVTQEDGSVEDKFSDLSYARLHPSDTNWVKSNGNLVVEIELEAATAVKSISFDALRYTISAYYPPSKVEVYKVDEEGQASLLSETDYYEDHLVQGRNKITSELQWTPQKIKRLQVKIFNYQTLPTGQHRAGDASRLAIDELVVF